MRRILVMSTCLCLAMVAGSCNHDGRELRPARSDQNATISTTAAPSTEPEPALGGVLEDLTPATGESPPATNVALPGGAAGQASLDAVAPWANGATIEPRYTCAGDDVTPALSWPAAPAGTVEIAITMIDEQQPAFEHWSLAGLQADRTSLAEGEIPAGVVQGMSGKGAIGYVGPCPPSGETHTYLITVHYLSSQIELGDGAPGADMRLAIDAATSASAHVSGTFKSG